MAVRGTRRRARKSSRTGCILWFLALCIFLILFVLRFNTIRDALQKSGLLDALNRTEQPASGNTRESPKPFAPSPPKTSPDIPSLDRKEPGTEPAQSQGTPSPAPSSPVSKDQIPKEPAQSSPAPATPAPVSPQPPSETAPAKKPRSIALYFVRIGEDGQIISQRVIRTIPASDTPLLDSAEALLKGPTQAELRSGLLTLIPAATRLRSITLQGSTAMIDLSEDFMYNRYGREGYLAQLRQVVFTLTEFSNVSEVRIFIEGKVRQFLSEGLPLDKPYRRSSF